MSNVCWPFLSREVDVEERWWLRGILEYLLLFLNDFVDASNQFFSHLTHWAIFGIVSHFSHLLQHDKLLFAFQPIQLFTKQHIIQSRLHGIQNKNWTKAMWSLMTPRKFFVYKNTTIFTDILAKIEKKNTHTHIFLIVCTRIWLHIFVKTTEWERSKKRDTDIVRDLDLYLRVSSDDRCEYVGCCRRRRVCMLRNKFYSFHYQKRVCCTDKVKHCLKRWTS